MIKQGQTPLLFLVSAPSGAGKTTLCRRLLAEFDFMTYSISCTTRPPRPSEVNGKSYHFLAEEEFQRRIDAGAFLEYARVYEYLYGTMRESVLEGMRAGKDVLMDLDIQGAENLRRQIQAAPADDPLRRGFVDIFIGPPSIEVLEQRLRGRGEDDDDVIALRLREAEKEIARWGEYQYAVVNDKLEESYSILRSIVIAEHHRNR